ncbi:cyclic nucleotide-binding domain-containing protein [Paracoccus aestuariivivens]|uniref:Cyclic nucleotide-binding domain-containing protein n=1 Tax=Paracoccus aestuariivivens TaxID=1820333 RepID=A0A6L6J9R9_9RHOB|nr:cyclic nucleotide-binding domain-containing protein [Paracoccus aestuariivivens]MTH77895.1 cyclic nucleotide-binding domain-containing protein [Paracoccus aestuariivivens]
MLLEDEVALLRKLPLFAGVDPCRLKVLCFASSRESFAPGEVLFRENEPNSGAYVIFSGSVDVHKAAEDSHQIRSGNENAVAIVGQSSMLNEGPYNATVTAVSPVEVLLINGSCFMQLMTSCRKSSEGVIRSLGAQLADKNTVTTPSAGAH